MAEISEILNKLLERTTQDEVNWHSTSNENAFVAVLGNASVIILEDRIHDAVFRILNQEGREIERLDSGTDEGSRWQDQLRELYIKARRVALGVDSTLDDILNALEKDDDLPF